jgi:hypothetical protein
VPSRSREIARSAWGQCAVRAIALTDADLQRFLLAAPGQRPYLSGGGGGSGTGGTVTVTETTGVDTVTGVVGTVGAGAEGTEGTTWVTGFVVELTVESAAPSGADEVAGTGANADEPLTDGLVSEGWSLIGVLRSAPGLVTAERRWRKAAALTVRPVTADCG